MRRSRNRKQRQLKVNVPVLASRQKLVTTAGSPARRGGDMPVYVTGSGPTCRRSWEPSWLPANRRRERFEERLGLLEQHGWTALADAVRRLVAGERNEDALYEGLDPEDTGVVDAILLGIEDPASLAVLMPEGERRS
jgi:hypothetical protein